MAAVIRASSRVQGVRAAPATRAVAVPRPAARVAVRKYVNPRDARGRLLRGFKGGISKCRGVRTSRPMATDRLLSRVVPARPGAARRHRARRVARGRHRQREADEGSAGEGGTCRRARLADGHHLCPVTGVWAP
eukprot:250502-Chlamydomonas_euryale.AAC.8